jgi:uncharacterized membrane protein YgcG
MLKETEMDRRAQNKLRGLWHGGQAGTGIRSKLTEKPGLPVLALFFMLISCCAAAAADYPQRGDRYVNDFAGILAKTDQDTLREMLKQLENKNGIEFAVVTVKSISDYHAGEEDVEDFAAGLFNAWGMENKNEKKSILMLVSIDDREMKIQPGDSYGFLFETVIQQVTNIKMIPYFKNGDYSRGIFEGVRGVIDGAKNKVTLFDLYGAQIAAGLAVLALAIIVAAMLRGKKPGTKKEKKDRPVIEDFGGGAVGGW